MNLVNFGEKANCKKIIFVQNRDHAQKGNLVSILIKSYLRPVLKTLQSP